MFSRGSINADETSPLNLTAFTTFPPILSASSLFPLFLRSIGVPLPL
jgi:hypothetical protein